MKCEVCQGLLEEYLDGELADREPVASHLIECAECSADFAALTAEQEMFARYDREIEVPPFLWTRVAAHAFADKPKRNWFARRLVLAGVMAITMIAIAIGMYLNSRQPGQNRNAVASGPTPNSDIVRPADPALPRSGSDRKPAKRRVRPAIKHATIDQSDVLSSDLGYPDLDDRDTAKHIEQSQILLRSIKNVTISDTDDDIDVSYDKALSRRLLIENVVLRRDAEMKAKFPTKTLLADLEPFLIDIANLPDRARPEDVRVIKERVQKTEIVAALADYQDRGINNR